MVDATGVMKNRLDRKSYLVILIQAFFNKNSDKNLLAENQICCYCVKVYLRPRIFGGKQLVEARYQVGHQVKLVISWVGFTRYLDVSLPARKDIDRLGYLKLTCREPYSTYIPFGTSNMQFKLDKPFLGTGRVKIAWTDKKIHEWKQRLGYVSSHLVKKIFEAFNHDYPGVRHEREA